MNEENYIIYLQLDSPSKYQVNESQMQKILDLHTQNFIVNIMTCSLECLMKSIGCNTWYFIDM